MWPGIKTETGLPDAPSGGQPGFLSFSSTYPPAQPAHLHHSYPNQGKLPPLCPTDPRTHTLWGDNPLWHTCFFLLLSVCGSAVEDEDLTLTSNLYVQGQASPRPACTPASYQRQLPPPPPPLQPPSRSVPFRALLGLACVGGPQSGQRLGFTETGQF